jgi:hypothetical protein
MAVFAFIQAIFLLCEYCKPRIWVLITCLICGVLCIGMAISALVVGIYLGSDNTLLQNPGPGFICIAIGLAFSVGGYIFMVIGACNGPKGSSSSCGKCCCDCGESGTGFSHYGGHQRFQNRPPVGGAPPSGGWRPPMSGMRPPMPMTPQPQMVPYQVPVPVPVPVQVPQPAPPQQINLNIRAVGPPAGGSYSSQPPPAPAPVVLHQGPPPSGGDDFGLDRR